MVAPVIMFGFNRPDVQELSMKCFANCYGARERDLYVFIDGPRNSNDEILSKQILKMLRSFKETGFQRMKIVMREHNLGCRENIVQGISEVISKYGRAIMIEDDILVSRTFLQFMDEALDTFLTDQRIWCINGFQKFFFKIPKNYAHDLYYSFLNCAWGWATWKDRWNAVDFDMSDWLDFKKDPENLEKLDKACYFLRSMLDAQYSGTLRTWDVQCMYHMVKNGLYAIEPRYQVSKNIGCRPGSEHFANTDPLMLVQKFYNYLPVCEKAIPFDDRIMKQYRYYAYNPNIVIKALRKLRRLTARWWGRPCYEPIDIQ